MAVTHPVTMVLLGDGRVVVSHHTREPPAVEPALHLLQEVQFLGSMEMPPVMPHVPNCRTVQRYNSNPFSAVKFR